MADIWIFGYGSLIWRPEVEFIEQRLARVDGWVRRFWQGSHDHRGVPHAPGRVVTLVPESAGACHGVAYLISAAVAQASFVLLDHREKNGFERHDVSLAFADEIRTSGVVYIAAKGNEAYLGPAPIDEMVHQIRNSVGPSGSNVAYLLELAAALRRLDVDDEHVFELERLVLLTEQTSPIERT
jgi:cation transport regulator ChaC